MIKSVIPSMLLVTRVRIPCLAKEILERGNTNSGSVENLGGRVAIDSIINSGTTVIIDLPI